ncbi:unnamed protein product [Alopecurus aequalis]
MGRRCKQVADDIAEEFCFVCKDGGDLRVCDFKNCLKAYHPSCVGKEDDFLSSNDQFVCDWHRCAICKRNSKYECFCCPSSSTCEDCLGKVQFVQLKESKGFCGSCLKMAIVTEKDADLEEARLVFAGAPENYEILFKDYWEVIKGKDLFTLLDLQAASIHLKRSLNCKESKDSDEYQKTDGKLLGGNDDAGLASDNADAGQTFLLDTTEKPSEVHTPLKRKKSNKKTYVDWASKELTEFLSSIGKDSTNPLDHYGVTAVVREYIQESIPQDKRNKKYVECDDKLRSLFNNKKKLKYNMIHSLLDTHLAVNAISEDESDEFEDSYASTVKKKPRNSLEPKTLKKVSSGINKSCLAALNQKNLNLIYLRKTLVLKLLSELDTFQQKVVGCLVRVKNDVKSYAYQMTRKHYQVGIVTGIKKSSEEYTIKDKIKDIRTDTSKKDIRTDILLCVSNMCDDVKISMLSEENFEEDECNDLLLSAKEGLFKRPTIAEFEEKEAIVHADIVNHWIDIELVRLEKHLGRAHEKGWRQEMHDLICKKKLLSTPAERQRRLEEIPEVIPDAEEQSKGTENESAASDLFQGNQGSRRNIAACLKDVEEISKDAAKQLSVSLKVIIDEPREDAAKQLPVSMKVIIDEPREDAAKQLPLQVIIDGPQEDAIEQLDDSLKVVAEDSQEGVTQKVAEPSDVSIDESQEGASLRQDAACEVAFEAGSKALCNGGSPGSGMYTPLHNCQDGVTSQVNNIDDGKDKNGSSQHTGGDKVVINLDSDDDEDLHMEQREPERATCGAPEATNGIAARTHHAPEAVDRQYTHHTPEVPNGIVVHTRDAPEAINGVTVPTLGASENLDGITMPKRSTSRAMTQDVALIVNRITESDKMWHYIDPAGHEQGPHSMDSLRRWQQEGFFDLGFRVWRTGQSRRKAIKLVDAMQMMY